MGKKLSEMTLEELWQLFPIFLTEHRDCWEARYKEESAFLKALLPAAVRISHIGSTAVPGIWAKPIIDILIELERGADMRAAADTLVGAGYLCMSEAPGRLSLNKGYTENGFADKVFHIHLRYRGDNDELYFRDLLREEPETAAAYEKLKLSLWKQFEHDRDGYTEAKTEFIRRYTDKARQKYGARYE